ncbi:MAG: pyridoxamine 5'-phosphate oxidase family protein [Thermoleophilia bacterium]
MIEELFPAEIDAVLGRAMVGRIGCHAEGRTYVVPVTFAMDGAGLVCHSAEGMKLRMMRANPEVCFEVDEVAGLSDWCSVIAWGTFRELEGAEAAAAMDALIARVAPMLGGSGAHGGRPPDPSAQAAIFRIDLRERTGRRERPAA